MTAFFASSGRKLTLGKQLGKGAEGAVHHVVEDSSLAAKIYNAGKAQERQEKVRAMVEALLHQKSDFVAFPVEALTNPTGHFVGFTMKKAAGFKSVHDLYGPASRKSEFPSADARFLVRAAGNLANAVASIHALGCVIGDINHSGILVSNKALVTVIDSDSFQLGSKGRLYKCLVGTAEYTPPELQGQSFEKIERTSNHDSFGLAVVLFQLLFLGRHPFAGRYSGPGDMDIHTAIRDGRFAYSARRSETKMEPPPYVPSLTDYGPELAKAFEAAFMLQKSPLVRRPTASEWVQNIKAVENQLVDCSIDKSHAYVRSLSACPWCSLERQMGRSLFAAQVSATSTVMDVGQLLTTIRNMTAPPSPPAPETVVGPLPPLSVSKAAAEARTERGVTMAAGIVAAAIGFYLMSQVNGFWGFVLLAGASVITFRSANLGNKFASEYAAAKKDWAEQTERWIDLAGPAKFERSRSHFLELAAKHSGLPNAERQQLAILEDRKRQLQLERHLESHLIARAKITGVGQGRKTTLASYGFENANDVLQRSVSSVPGFGQALAGNLVDWAKGVERKFVFNAAIPTDPAAVQRVKSEITRQRAELERQLRRAPSQLQDIINEAAQMRSKPPQSFVDAYVRLKQVELDIG